MAGKAYDIVVWGATGFAGRLVCERIAENYQGRIRWAMAGRSKAKLEQVKEGLVKLNPRCQDVPILLADLADTPSLDSMVAQANVVMAMAGPYAQMGTPIVDSCVRQGSHYCDITGETFWVRRMIDRYHEQAVAKGAKIVSCCGFDSVPSDLGVLVVVDHIKNRLKKNVGVVKSFFDDLQGGISGGTIASALGFFSIPMAESRTSTGPYALNPPESRGNTLDRGTDQWLVGYDRDARSYTAPFLMALVNSRVVRRSAALLGYGEEFGYREVMGCRSWFSAAATSAGLLAVGGAFALTFLHPLWKRILPKSGEGPSPEAQMNGQWHVTVIGKTAELGGGEPTTVTADAAGSHDPGYYDTSRMALECALCLALQPRELAAAGLPGGGCLTPAAAMGMVLVERLNAAGFTFKVRDA